MNMNLNTEREKMKTKLSIITTIFLVLIFSSTAFAMDLTGMWDVTYYYRNNPTTMKHFIKQTGDTFTFDRLPGVVDGDKYTVTQGFPGRRDIKVAWIGSNGMEFRASDENNFKGTLSISLYASEKSPDKMRTLGVKIIGRKIENPDPRIVPMGGLNVYIKTGSDFKDTGVFAHDGEGNSLTDKVVKSGTVDTSKPGTYKITYNVTDANGKKAPEIVKTVNVVNPAPPTISIKGDENTTVTKGTLYSDPGAKALNYLKEDISHEIKVLVNGNEADPNNPAVINTSKPDVGYTITFLIEDENGKAQAERNVMVKGSEDEQSFWSYCFISALAD